MPSGRPRLVEEGSPITGTSTNAGDTSTQFTLRGPHSHLSSYTPPKPGSYYTAAHSSSEMMTDTPPTTTTSKQGTSSLARAAQGQFIRSGKPKTGVQTSFVVGGATAATAAAISAEKKEQGVSMMALDNHPHHHRPAAASTQTCYQVPSTSPCNNTSYHSSSMMNVEDSSNMHIGSRLPTATKFTVSSNSSSQAPAYVAGQQAMQQAQNPEPAVDKMEGVIDLSSKPPLVIIDGANAAYAYAQGGRGTSLSGAINGTPEPDAKGIDVVCNYFLEAGIRVLAVVPAPWMNRKPTSHDHTQSNALMVTPQLEVLKDLKERGLLVVAPPRDDDDAYCISVARREEFRSQQRGNQEGTGFVLSNDMFRDAMQREEREHHENDGQSLRDWLSNGNGTAGPGRISFSFCDMGAIDDHGDRVLDIVPNPRHPLIRSIERIQQNRT